jgi:hypothetical protein
MSAPCSTHYVAILHIL